MSQLATLFIPVLAAVDLSVGNWLGALVVLIIGVILFVAVWPLVRPFLGQFANLVLAIVVIILILIIAHFFGIV